LNRPWTPRVVSNGCPYASFASAVSPEASGESVLEGSLPLLDGSRQDLADFEGEVVLVVNTATECGYTPQFEGLQELL
jgi:hypothetical protein